MGDPDSERILAGPVSTIKDACFPTLPGTTDTTAE